MLLCPRTDKRLFRSDGGSAQHSKKYGLCLHKNCTSWVASRFCNIGESTGRDLGNTVGGGGVHVGKGLKRCAALAAWHDFIIGVPPRSSPHPACPPPPPFPNAYLCVLARRLNCCGCVRGGFCLVSCVAHLPGCSVEPKQKIARFFYRYIFFLSYSVHSSLSTAAVKLFAAGGQ